MNSGFNQTVERLVIALGEAFRQKVSEPTINAYRIGLAGLTEKQLQQAGMMALQSSKFMPSPAELRELVNGTSEDLAILAWGLVEQAMPIGGYRPVDFGDRFINATIRNLGGWEMLFAQCADAESESFYRARFLKTYKAMRAANVDGEACKPLGGLSEYTAVGGRIAIRQPEWIDCGKLNSQSQRIEGEQNGRLENHQIVE